MLRRCVYLQQRNRAATDGIKDNPASDKSVKLMREVGTWLYTREVTADFQRWCRVHEVRSYGNIKMCSTMQYARCLRLARPVRPGQAVVTVPAAACFNFLTVAKEMSDAEGCVFPLRLNWMNYNDRVPFLPSAAQHEVATAGWLVRIASLEDSPFTPYVRYLLQDTRGKDGVSTGITREREANAGLVDHYFSEMAVDACEDPQVFLERLFIAFACMALRAQPIEAAALEHFIPGTEFFKAKAGEMFVPTLMPLIDAVPQLEDEGHNAVVQYFPYEGRERLREQYAELGLLDGGAPSAGQPPADEQEEEVTLPDGRRAVVTRDRQLMSDAAVAAKGGFFALRAMTALEEGDVLYVRRYPFDGDASKSRMEAQIAEANIILTNDN